jgi:hypothetical protein
MKGGESARKTTIVETGIESDTAALRRQIRIWMDISGWHNRNAM